MAWLLLAWSVAAPAAYVTDRLAAGLYAQPREGRPLRVLPSGTPVERLGRKDGFCRVRTGSGETGWIRCRYLSEDKPARQALLQCLAEKAELRREAEKRCPATAPAETPASPPSAPSGFPWNALLALGAGLALGGLGGLLLGRR